MRQANGNQRGIAAMVTVLAFMAFALPATAAALSLSSTLSIDSRIKTTLLDCHYAALAGEQHARYVILTDVASLGITEETPVVLNLDFNGCAVAVEISMSSAMVAGGGMTMEDIDYTFLAGHQIEVKTTVNQDSDQHMLVAYDTVDHPAAANFPSPGGDRTFYLHNYPTPPVDDTEIQLPLPMDESVPTAVTLYNYSTDRHNDPGRFLQRGGHQTDETHPFKYQNWQSEELAGNLQISGDVTFDMWVAMNMFNPDWAGMFNICLRDLFEGAYTEIDCTTMLVETEQWEEGGFTGVSGDESYDVVTTSGGTVLYSRVDP